MGTKPHPLEDFSLLVSNSAIQPVGKRLLFHRPLVHTLEPALLAFLSHSTYSLGCPWVNSSPFKVTTNVL